MKTNNGKSLIKTLVGLTALLALTFGCAEDEANEGSSSAIYFGAGDRYDIESESKGQLELSYVHVDLENWELESKTSEEARYQRPFERFPVAEVRWLGPNTIAGKTAPENELVVQLEISGSEHTIAIPKSVQDLTLGVQAIRYKSEPLKVETKTGHMTVILSCLPTPSSLERPLEDYSEMMNWITHFEERTYPQLETDELAQFCPLIELGFEFKGDSKIIEDGGFHTIFNTATGEFSTEAYSPYREYKRTRGLEIDE